MTPEQQVAIYTPAYSWVELLLIGLILAAAFILPTLSAWEIARKERRAADIKGKAMPSRWGWS